jgi:hypothetical protein
LSNADLNMRSAVEEFLATKRALLNRLERFVSTNQYQRLQTVIGGAGADLPEAWLLPARDQALRQ